MRMMRMTAANRMIGHFRQPPANNAPLSRPVLSEDFFIYWKNRLHRPETFAADYCQGVKRPAILGFGGEWQSEKSDPDDVLDELLEFVMGDAQFVPGLNINLVKETRALVIPKAKAAPGPGESLARATRSLHLLLGSVRS